ncbi:MAG: class I SAM-dependent methyltransferase [Thermoplasmata archaeon]|nr:class I SAM-dependent methyltransferase [Thermoplasmata archaeon]
MEPPDVDHLYYQGPHYDQRYRVITEDIPFWIRRAEEYGDPVLELAIGTGRVAIPMVKEGFKVTGIDISDSMMDVGKEKTTREGVDIEWVVGDIRDFHLGKKFNLIIFPLNTICHLLRLEDLESCLSCVKDHMLPEGGFVVDAFVPDQERLARDPTERFFNTEYEDPEGKGMVKIFESNEYDPTRQVNRVRFYYQIPGRTEELVEELNMRMFFPQELDALLKHNGFRIEAKYGDYDDAPFGRKSPKQMVVCSLQE